MVNTYQKHNSIQCFRAIRKDPIAFFSDVAQTSGDFSQFKVLFYRYVFVNDPDLIREALLERKDAFILKGGTVSGLARLLGQGILTNHGEDWRQSRSHIQPLFQHNALESYSALIRDRVQESVQRWKTELAGTRIALNRELVALFFRVICSTLFQYRSSFEEALEFADAAAVLQVDGMIRFTNGGDLLPWLPLPRIRRVNKAAAKIKQLAEAINASGCSVPLDEIRSLLFAGTESPANTVCWSLKLLEESPYWREELLRRNASLDDEEHFDSLSKVVCETMRLYPAGWAFERLACENTTLGGEPIAKGTRLFISPYLLHRNEKFWQQPEAFDPSRFAHSAFVVPGVPKFGYLPFGAGPRSCIGGRLAWTGMRTTLAAMMTQCRWKLVEQPGDVPLSPRGTFKMRFNRPVFMTLHC